MTKHKAKRAISVLHDVSFLKSATNETNFPPATVPEIAIIGRSNAGKSSILNTICGRKKLALVSKTPGKTQLINFFSIKHNQIEVARIVDLPGYGYARVNKSTKSFWNKELLKFLKKRENLIGIILVTDIRHALGKLDKKIFFSLDRSKIFYHVLFNKSDKLNKSEQKKKYTLSTY